MPGVLEVSSCAHLVPDPVICYCVQYFSPIDTTVMLRNSGGPGSSSWQWKTRQRKHWIIFKPFCDTCCTFPCHFCLVSCLIHQRPTHLVCSVLVLTYLEKVFLLPSTSSFYFHLCSRGWCFCIVLKWTVPTSTLHTLSNILGFFLIFLWGVVFAAFIFAEGIFHEAFCMPSFFTWWLLLKFHCIQLEKCLSLNK